jgi:serine/threonine protein kinase/tetratricopeptide (TPR) repeat protein
VRRESANGRASAQGDVSSHETVTESMTPQRWKRIEDLLLAALEVPEAERDGFLSQACVEDDALRLEVESLLVAHASSGPADRLADTLGARLLTEFIEGEGLEGETVGRYEIGERLGRGGMSIVYRAWDPKLERHVALKFLPGLISSDEASRQRLLAEAQMAAGLEHPNICTIHEIGEAEDGRLFIAMPLYDGETLQAKLESGPLSEKEAVRLALQAARGLAKAHDCGVIHRDIKPGNLMITRDDTLKILDFGIAQLEGAADPMGRTPGTAHYMSPEQVTGGSVDGRSDLFSLGVVLYEMLAGQRPFEGKTPEAVKSAIAHEEAVPLAQVLPGISTGLEALTRALLQKDASRRPGSAAEVAEELRRLRKRVSSPPGSGLNRDRSHRLLSLSVGVAALLAVGGLIVAYGPGDDALRIRRLAVLPLSIPSDDPEDDYFAAGMHDALIGELGKIGALSVTARQSVLRYERSDRPVPAIAAELGVDALVEGSVFRTGDSVRITVQLVRAEPEESLWTGSFHGGTQEALGLQGEVARALAGAVRAQLAPEESARLATRAAVDPQAQEEYLRGLYLVQKHATMWMTPAEGREALGTAIRHLEKAVTLEPEWAAAHAKLALAYHWLASRFADQAEEFYPKSKAAALRALELDETNAQAHASLGFVLQWHEREWIRAEREMRRAIELEPSSHHSIYAHLLNSTGRYEEALAQYRAAEEHNPLSELLQLQIAFAYRCAGRHEEALARMQELEARAVGDLPDLGAEIGYEYSALSRHEEAIAELEAVAAREDSLPQALAMLAYVYARAGKADEARRLFERLQDRPEAWFAPELYAEMDQPDLGVSSLASFMERRPGRIGGYKCTAAYRALGDNPRIQAVVRRHGFATIEGR